MLLRMLPAAVLALAASVQAPAQTTGPSTSPSPAATPAPAARTRRAATPQRGSAATAADLAAVRDAFDTLIDGIRKADAAAVMGVYWNSPRLMLFNNNGTVTRGWEQVRSNRESLYARVKDVKLDVRDVDVKLLGPSAALVTCLWEQSQTADGQPERGTGRLTLVFQKAGAKWAAVHAHTSPDRPDPSRILPSERTGEGDAGTARPPARP